MGVGGVSVYVTAAVTENADARRYGAKLVAEPLEKVALPNISPGPLPLASTTSGNPELDMVKVSCSIFSIELAL